LPRAASPATPGKALPFARKVGKEDLSPLRGGKLTREGISPSREKEVYERRIGTYPKGQDIQAHGEWIPWGDLLSSPENAHGGRAAEVHCGRLAEGIITTAGAVMTDKTGWSSPIGVVRQAE
jgi:hypothetical protein